MAYAVYTGLLRIVGQVCLLVARMEITVLVNYCTHLAMKVESPCEKKKLEAFYQCLTMYSRAFCIETLAESGTVKATVNEWVLVWRLLAACTK